MANVFRLAVLVAQANDLVERTGKACQRARAALLLAAVAGDRTALGKDQFDAGKLAFERALDARDQPFGGRRARRRG
jgi:hypothetical protein